MYLWREEVDNDSLFWDLELPNLHLRLLLLLRTPLSGLALLLRVESCAAGVERRREMKHPVQYQMGSHVAT